MTEELLVRLLDKVENRYYGKYRAFVADNADPENRGRLKLRIPSVLGNDVVSGWALPCAPYGGAANHGFFFIPEVDASVWAEFEAGNLDYPVWVGTFWSKPGGDSEVPKPNQPDGSEESSVQDPATRKIIKTLKGHTLQFEDADGEEMITIVEATHGHVITMNQDGITVTDGANQHVVTLDAEGIKALDGANSHEIVLNGSGITLTDGVNSGNVVVLDSGGVTINSAADVTITGENINFEATSAVNATGSDINIEASAALNADGNEITLTASGDLTAKGATIKLN